MLTRRFLLATGLALAVIPSAGFARIRAYTPGLAEQAMREGKRIVLIFGADWCSTCRRQERIINDLRAAVPRYDAELTLIRVDWDAHGTGDLSRALAVPRRSTLIAFHGETELARIVAGTREADIKALMDRALRG
ncbi:thioredoxin family protein [Paracoccaceae bacterium Fryx2]|nr:thioredoxin family protein [Paracoccaceae bacterium Fryx2]